MTDLSPQSERLQGIIAKNADGSGGWEEAWQEKVTPWDYGELQPPLEDLLKSRQLDLPKSGRALVPGCGKGYDPIFIANELGFDSIAVDISATAVQHANDLLKTSKMASGAGSVTFKLQDFFAYKVSEQEHFDLIYDYTFFVAIPPTMRADWGRQMNSLIKPGGYLITLVFPIDPPVERGPPFFVRPEHYPPLLGSDWEKVLDKVPERSAPSHVNRERLVVWRKK